MLSAIQMLFSPVKAWEKVVSKNRHWTLVLLLMVLPILGLTAVAEGAGLLKLKQTHETVGKVEIPRERVIKYEIVYAATSLAIIVLGGCFLLWVGDSFNLRVSYTQTFTVVAFAYAPIMLLHLLDAIPQIHTWICWSIGVALSFRVLYDGVALCLRPEQTKGFGLLLFTALFITALSGLAHFASLAVLKGNLWRAPLQSARLIP